MTVCETCGNDYDRAFTVSRDGESWTFDSIECAASKLAPHCAQCGCRVLGHGLEQEGTVYCCAHCARRAGHDALVDSA
ncbi:hypothetical protein AB0H20_19395 [Nocardia fluminea]|uniref:Metallothionein n=1 Tax=Nocardia fluminea TaxID=134984 RepID=A0A2N3WXA9_9NOCA|nr:hypothetical protein [Nocardia fluminea]PKV98497.1 hypothetical protein ATK86_0517 [Nocardia fluminea]